MQNKKALEQSEKAIEQGTKAIEQNEKALQVSNKELELTRNELANSATALEEQAKLLAVQSFETTFFNMLELHFNMLKNINFSSNEVFELIYRDIPAHHNIKANSNYENGDKAIYSFIEFVGIILSVGNTQKNAVEIFDMNLDHIKDIFGSYFRNIYQILRFLSNNKFDDETKKKYSSILRAQLSNQQLAFFVLNCLSDKVDAVKLKKLLIEFSILEHLNIKYFPEGQNTPYFKIMNPKLTINTESINCFLKIDENNKVIGNAFGSNSQVLKFCEEMGYRSN